MSYVHLDQGSFVADLIRKWLSDSINFIQKDLQLVEINNKAWATAAFMTISKGEHGPQQMEVLLVDEPG